MPDPFSGYDQWKTASPYEDDLPEMCPQCGKPWADEDGVELPGSGVPPFCSPECETADEAQQRAANEDAMRDRAEIKRLAAQEDRDDCR